MRSKALKLVALVAALAAAATVVVARSRRPADRMLSLVPAYDGALFSIDVATLRASAAWNALAKSAGTQQQIASAFADFTGLDGIDPVVDLDRFVTLLPRPTSGPRSPVTLIRSAKAAVLIANSNGRPVPTRHSGLLVLQVEPEVLAIGSAEDLAEVSRLALGGAALSPLARAIAPAKQAAPIRIASSIPLTVQREARVDRWAAQVDIGEDLRAHVDLDLESAVAAQMLAAQLEDTRLRPGFLHYVGFKPVLDALQVVPKNDHMKLDFHLQPNELNQTLVSIASLLRGA